MKTQNTSTKQTVVLPVRMSKTTYKQLKETAEDLGVKSSIYIKSLIINDLRLNSKSNSFEELFSNIPNLASPPDRKIMKEVIRQIKKFRRGENDQSNS